MALQKTIIHGTPVYFEDNAKAGAEHLAYDLQYEEAAVFFRHARAYGSAQFEDDQERQFILLRNPDGTYLIKRRL
ncbi:MAG: hypothetical protein N2259_01860 [Patescibacteria group bacterium]|nr:hypothetical protein [Patescibacteria group bacterium]